MRLLRLFLLLGALACGSAWAQLAPIPALTGHVVDEIGMLSATQRQQLESVLTAYEQKTGNQIAILLVAKTEPEAVEQYSIRVADAWKLGRKGVDDGVLLLVARDNPSALRRLRIEAGRGVQGVLTDAQSKRILQDVIAPHFRKAAWYDGLVAGATAIAGTLDKESFAAPQRAQSAPVRDSTGSLWWVPLLLVAVFAMGRVFRSPAPALGRGGWGSGAAGFILGNALGQLSRGAGRSGGWDGGGMSGGGGFSGGGGSFDGGGASGDW